jgi:ubiquinone/menaquinone biosynthesis C-methylase UbiE
MQGIEFWDQFYETMEHSDQSPFTAELCDKIESLIPDDTSTILDAGCGGGALMHRLARTGRWDIGGVDTSSAGVWHVVSTLGRKASIGSITALGFHDNAFDLVICSEVVEHLREAELADAFRQLFRVAKKAVIVTTPYREHIKYHQVRCNHCCSEFHMAGHIRPVDEQFFRERISNYTANYEFHFSGTRPYRSVLFAELIRMLGHNVIWRKDLDCPICGGVVDKNESGYIARGILVLYRIFESLTKHLGLFSQPNNIILLAYKQ